MHDFSIVAIASPLEQNYIDEWLDWHRKIGVQHFFIATNGWKWDNAPEDASTFRLDGRGVQCAYYTWFAKNMASLSRWAAFIDIDEFIKLGSKHSSVLDLARENEHKDAICLSWRLFGSSGLHFDGNYSVLQRFTHRQKGFNKHVKTILNLGKLASFGENAVTFFSNPHFAYSKSCTGIVSYSVDGRRTYGPYDTLASAYLKDDDAWLAHFFCKTPEEWKLKQKQGRVDVTAGSSSTWRKDEEFSQHDFNDVEDLHFKNKAFPCCV